MGKILVTGSTGFLGNNLLQYLTKNLVLIVRDKTKLNQIKKSWIVYETKVIDEEALRMITEDIDVIIHCAAVMRTDKAASDENIRLTSALLNVFSKKIKLFIFMSSVHVYDHSQKLITEESNLHPISAYAEGKLTEEKLIKESCQNYIILRLSPLYGAKEPHKKIISVLIENAMNNKITIIDKPNERKDYVFIDDVCDVISQLVKRYDNGHIKEMFNVTSGKNYSLAEIADITKSILNENTIQADILLGHNTSESGIIYSNKKIKKLLCNVLNTSLYLGIKSQIEAHITVCHPNI